MIPWLDLPVFPPVNAALCDPPGLLAAGGELTAEWLLIAYRQGVFPWYMPGQPILWWSPDPRMVLFPDELHIGRSLAKVLRNRHYEIRLDTAFSEVMAACAEPRAEAAGTWITHEMCEAYGALHDKGYAHSVETWIDGKLAGGLYGVAIGDMFFGESMFARTADASKLAFAHVVPWLRQQGFGLIDCQMHTQHLARFGGREIPRGEFCNRLAVLVTNPRAPCTWRQVLIKVSGCE